jgi:intracellular septation protein A
MLGSGPRFGRDALGPVLTFYAGWKLVGFQFGVIAATLVALAIFVWERRHGRRGLAIGIGLFIALVQAAAGLATGSTVAYFAPAVIINGVYGLAFLVSVLIGRPLAGVFAVESYPFPPEVAASPTFRSVFSVISLVWAAYLLSRAVVRWMVLTRASVDLYILVNVVTGPPLIAAIMTWSIWYAFRRFQRELGGATSPSVSC